MVYSIEDDDISPAKTAEEIQMEIYGLISYCFITDQTECLDVICQYISKLYLQRTKMMLQIYHILPEFRDNFEKMNDDLADIKQLILENNKKELRLRHEREVLLKKELHNEITNILTEMFNRFLYLLLKKSPTYEGDITNDLPTAMANKVREIIADLPNYVQKDFMSLPVILTRVNGFESYTEEISSLKYSEFYFRKCILDSTSNLMKYHELIDQESYLAILRVRNTVQGNLFPEVYALGQGQFFDDKAIVLNDTTWAQEELRLIGENLLVLYNNLVR